MSIQNLSALEERNTDTGNGIGSSPYGGDGPEYVDAERSDAYVHVEEDEDLSTGPSGLDALRARTLQKVSKTAVIEVPGRDGIALEVEAYIESGEMREWTKLSRLSKNRPASDDNIDGVLLGARAVAAKTKGIRVDGRRLIDENSGDPLTFLDDTIKGMYSARTPWDAAAALVGSDPGVLNIFQTLMEESGYANSAEVLNAGK